MKSELISPLISYYTLTLVSIAWASFVHRASAFAAAPTEEAPMPDKNRQAHFDETATAVVIERLTVRDKDVAREAQRWTAGERGPIVDDPDTLAAADLSHSSPRRSRSAHTRCPRPARHRSRVPWSRC